MSSLIPAASASGTGSMTLAAPVTNSNLTVTLPAASGTAMVSGAMPAFSAYQSSAQSLTNNVNTKIQFQTIEFDTNNCFDNTTNYRFTPTVAGYYQVSGGVYLNTGAGIYIYVAKNGSTYKVIQNSFNTSPNAGFGSCLVYLNGSTDYIELYASIGTSQSLVTGQINTYFQASMVRAA